MQDMARAQIFSRNVVPQIPRPLYVLNLPHGRSPSCRNRFLRTFHRCRSSETQCSHLQLALLLAEPCHCRRVLGVLPLPRGRLNARRCSDKRAAMSPDLIGGPKPVDATCCGQCFRSLDALLTRSVSESSTDSLRARYCSAVQSSPPAPGSPNSRGRPATDTHAVKAGREVLSGLAGTGLTSFGGPLGTWVFRVAPTWVAAQPVAERAKISRQPCRALSNSSRNPRHQAGRFPWSRPPPRTLDGRGLCRVCLGIHAALRDACPSA